MTELDEIYKSTSLSANVLAEYILRKLKTLNQPERDALTEAFSLLVEALAEINQASFYRRRVNE
jgi:hypothetical protein